MPRRASAPTAVGVPTAAASTSSAAAGPSKLSSAAPSSPQAGPSTVSTSSSNPNGPTRQRRIMPSRSRRGGPGVGICDVDTQILETLRRRRENEPLVPAHTKLLLTTSSTRVRAFGEASGSEGSQLNTSAYERYFDKPEVIRAYREQQVIQTPEFTLLSEHEAVGGRFRPRGLDDEGIDTSDAAYEKRHRKYEAFEKRQRLREKEKLKHEHYKLKERIEQLRVLEPSAFIGISDSFFAGSLRPPPNDDERDGITDAPAPSHNDGEGRKRQMLEVANSLDARYRTLLDTAPSRVPDLPAPTPQPLPPTEPLVHTLNHAVRSPAPTSPTTLRPQSALSSTNLTEVIELDSDGEEQTHEVVKAESIPASPGLTRNETTESLKLRIRFPSRLPPSTSPLTATPPSPSSPRSAAAGPSNLKGSPSPTRPRPKPIFKNPEAPSPYARVPFVKRTTQQEGVAPSPSSPSPPTRSHNAVATTAADSAPSTSAPLPTPAHPTLRRRPPRAASNSKPGSPVAAGVTNNSRAPPPPPPPTAHSSVSSRARKRRRIAPSDDERNELLGSDIDANGEVDMAGEGAEQECAEEEEEEGEGEEEGDEGDKERESSHNARWRDSALYREAQRLAGAPNARKTHRHLGIFGLKGFPAEIDHLHDFVVPEWAFPRGDLRLVALRDGDAVPLSMENVQHVAAGGSSGGGRGETGMREEEEEEEEEALCAKSDRMVDFETATLSAVDSQATEELMIF